MNLFILSSLVVLAVYAELVDRDIKFTTYDSQFLEGQNISPDLVAIEGTNNLWKCVRDARAMTDPVGLLKLSHLTAERILLMSCNHTSGTLVTLPGVVQRLGKYWGVPKSLVDLFLVNVIKYNNRFMRFVQKRIETYDKADSTINETAKHEESLRQKVDGRQTNEQIWEHARGFLDRDDKQYHRDVVNHLLKPSGEYNDDAPNQKTCEFVSQIEVFQTFYGYWLDEFAKAVPNEYKKWGNFLIDFENPKEPGWGKCRWPDLVTTATSTTTTTTTPAAPSTFDSNNFPSFDSDDMTAYGIESALVGSPETNNLWRCVKITRAEVRKIEWLKWLDTLSFKTILLKSCSVEAGIEPLSTLQNSLETLTLLSRVYKIPKSLFELRLNNVLKFNEGLFSFMQKRMKVYQNMEAAMHQNGSFVDESKKEVPKPPKPFHGRLWQHAEDFLNRKDRTYQSEVVGLLFNKNGHFNLNAKNKQTCSFVSNTSSDGSNMFKGFYDFWLEEYKVENEKEWKLINDFKEAFANPNHESSGRCTWPDVDDDGDEEKSPTADPETVPPFNLPEFSLYFPPILPNNDTIGSGHYPEDEDACSFPYLRNNYEGAQVFVDSINNVKKCITAESNSYKAEIRDYLVDWLRTPIFATKKRYCKMNAISPALAFFRFSEQAKKMGVSQNMVNLVFYQRFLQVKSILNIIDQLHGWIHLAIRNIDYIVRVLPFESVHKVDDNMAALFSYISTKMFKDNNKRNSSEPSRFNYMSMKQMVLLSKHVQCLGDVSSIVMKDYKPHKLEESYAGVQSLPQICTFDFDCDAVPFFEEFLLKIQMTTEQAFRYDIFVRNIEYPGAGSADEKQCDTPCIWKASGKQPFVGPKK